MSSLGPPDARKTLANSRRLSGGPPRGLRDWPLFWRGETKETGLVQPGEEQSLREFNSSFTTPVIQLSERWSQTLLRNMAGGHEKMGIIWNMPHSEQTSSELMKVLQWNRLPREALQSLSLKFFKTWLHKWTCYADCTLLMLEKEIGLDDLWMFLLNYCHVYYFQVYHAKRLTSLTLQKHN